MSSTTPSNNNCDTRSHEEKAPAAADVAEEILNATYRDDQANLMLCSWHGNFWEWDGRMYRAIPENDIRSWITRCLQDRPETRHSAGTSYDIAVRKNLAALTHVPDSLTQPIWLDGREEGDGSEFIQVENGILSLAELVETGSVQLESHTPLFFSPFCLPYPYDSKAACPQWLAFLKEVLPDEADRSLLQEWFGYCLIPDTSLQKFLLMSGEGGNGKSVVNSVLADILGHENVSSIPIERFGEKHYIAQTKGKLANITHEVDAVSAKCESVLKACASGDSITFNEKFKPVYTERPTARVVIAANDLPRFRDRSWGLWRRMILLHFPVIIPDDDQDSKLSATLHEELSGVLNWSVTGRIRLMERGQFELPEDSKQAVQEYRKELNPARLFLETHYEADAGFQVTTEAIYSRFRDWCAQNGYRAMDVSQFGREVHRIFPDVKKKRLRDSRGIRVQDYHGLRGPDATPILTVEIVSSTASEAEDPLTNVA